MGHKENNQEEERDSFEETPYLRRQRAISVKRTQVEASKLVLFSQIFLALVALAGLGMSIRSFGEYAATSPKFDLSIREVRGIRNLSEATVMQQLAPLIGQNIFRANYNERIRALMQIPWVESVEFLRFWPASLSVIITERVPVGYALIGGAVELIDKEGIPLGASRETQQHFDFPIVRGLTGENTTNDHVMNRLRISRYMDLLGELESGREGYSADLSEVDISDPDDVRVILKNDPILVHLGKESLLPRFKLYLANIKKLKQDYPDIDAVDLRFKDQIIIKRQETSREAKAKTST
ncbi:MAG: FtsQ-type POTRA domain-containing protein [Acidobacteriia bacterium]|nr:FtsQ-type POTRA domain-containing protein [Terriglobia bacterium]